MCNKEGKRGGGGIQRSRALLGITQAVRPILSRCDSHRRCITESRLASPPQRAWRRSLTVHMF